MISIMIADDHQMFREGLSVMLDSEKDIQVIDVVSNGKEVIKRLGLRTPDILLLDIEMPLQDGFDTLKWIKNEKIPTKVLALTMHKSSEFIKRIFMSGASGYIQKDMGRKELVKAILTLYKEGMYYTPEISKIVMESLKNKNQKSQISKREKEIIKLIADQLTTSEIAKRLHISPKTVESHRQNILLKLSLKNTAGLVKYAIQKGII
ncbi:response regulator transcription factor [Aquimarina gracilis]|uniref:Response regulator transcription factor n=1 Tax=Aquimarina gracilis TaxID=874422 RepID=A0ABU5ZQG7_9FLAO|nr:response regulator transcription factor [Aquimarina gracilis]MEB3343908.1 response regulator transcription factor [Aquimarina gracilis]